jgi:hypothetical protein
MPTAGIGRLSRKPGSNAKAGGQDQARLRTRRRSSHSIAFQPTPMLNPTI